LWNLGAAATVTGLPLGAFAKALAGKGGPAKLGIRRSLAIIENKAVLATRGKCNRVRSVRIVPVLVISDASQISLQLPHVFSVEIENCVGHEASHIDFVDLDAVFEIDDSAILSEKIFCR
jgi:hypothetical protein